MNKQENNNAENQSQQENDVMFPGIDLEMIRSAGIRPCLYPECLELTGSFDDGILFPYYNIDGSPVKDGEKHYCRLRLNRPLNGKKYHQQAGSAVHNYVPPGHLDRAASGVDLYLIEGEKKALSLACEGRAVIGMSGFYGYSNGSKGWTEEFLSCLIETNPTTVFFIGDQDVISNPQFSDAAVKLTKTFTETQWENTEVRVLIVPPDGLGKGMDDCRAKQGASFRPWFEGLVQSAIVISSDTTSGQLAMALLELHREALAADCRGSKKQSVHNGLAKLAAKVGDFYTADAIKGFAVGLGFNARPFGKAVNAFCKKLSTDPLEEEAGEQIFIDLSEQAGKWTSQCLEVLKDETYVTVDGRLGRLCGEEIMPFEPHSLPPFLDDPEHCRFVVTMSDGQRKVAKFEQKQAQLVLGAVQENMELLRPVRLVSSIPVLVENSDQGVEVITGYSREHELLVTSCIRQPGTVEREMAYRYLYNLVKDFEFDSTMSYATCVALILTPALVRGGFLGSGRAPFFAISKDQKGAGGGTFCRLISTLYGHPSTSITLRNPDRAYESVSEKLFKGSSILYLDNVRGNVLTDLPFLESLLTEPIFDARALYRHGAVKVERLVMMATSNGMKLSPDLADRTVEIRIKKRGVDYQFTRWTEGDLFAHIDTHREFYLGCIYSLISEWVIAGKLGGQTTGFRFSQWEAAIAGIFAGYPNYPLQLFPEGVRSRGRVVNKLSSPDFEEIEMLCHDICAREQVGIWLTTADIVRITRDPSCFMGEEDIRAAAQALGMKLKVYCDTEGVFKDVGDQFVIQNRKTSLRANHYKSTNQYLVARVDQIAKS